MDEQREKAIKICKDLNQTISKMTKGTHIEHKNEVYEIPRAKKRNLIKIRKNLINKYQLTETELK